MINKPSVLLTSFLLASVFIVNAQGNSYAQYADNTKVNERDRLPQAVTADEQGQSKADLGVTQAIRKAIVADGQLSTYGHNVKVITKDGMVTLKGPVDTTNEVTIIAALASRTVPMNRINNELEVVTK